MNIINARLRGKPGLYRIELVGERIAAIHAQPDVAVATADSDVDAGQNLVTAPFVEPHIHLDATLTAGEPAWNMSGTLFEGIERWAE
ncbi:cytosine deaminase, partial [Klebsiella pneumoniae]|nr:cytosine deaminase [Klebsiella pneumoniae]